MKPMIDQAFWSDADVEAAKPGIKLAALWLMTNGQTSLIGVCGASHNRFCFETGLPAKALDGVLEALPRAFKRFGSVIFVRNYIRHQFGSGDKLKKNNFFISLRALFLSIKDPELRAFILAEYPEFDSALSDGRVDDDARDHVASNGLRAAILERDEYTCVFTGEVMPESQLEVDHVVSRSKGGKTEPENLVAMAKSLNTKKNKKAMDDFCREQGFDFEVVMKRVKTRASKPLPGFSKPKISKEKIGKDKASVDEASEYCLSIGLPKSDGQWFVDKCIGNGWTNGGEPIKDWKATIRAWKTAGYMASQKGGNGTGDHVERMPAAFRAPMNAPPTRPEGV